MTDQWFRVYNTVRHDRKIRKLSDQNFRVWIMLLSVASEENGKIPKDFEDLAMELHLSVGKTRDALQVLLSAGLIEELPENGYIPHKWHERQFKSDTSTPRVKRFRERQGNVSETAPESEQNRTEQNRDGFDAFWKSYPRRISKRKAEEAFALAVTEAAPDVIIRCAERFAAKTAKDGTDERFIPSPVTWLENRDWLSDPSRESAFDSPEEKENQRILVEKYYGNA